MNPVTAAAAPKFSVVIPLYNKAAYVAKTLQSVSRQTQGDFEVIVVDDGSTDGGADIVARFPDARVQLLRVPNGGVSRARNHGIQMARGEWIAFLDADDWHHEAYLGTIDALIENHPGLDVVSTRYANVPHDPALDPSDFRGPVIDQQVELIDDLPTRWMQSTTFFTGSVVVRKRVLDALQPCFPEGESFGEDLDLWFRLGARGPIALHHANLVWRFVVADSLTSSHRLTVEPPFLQRLEHRAAQPSTDAAQRVSIGRFVREARISFARDALTRGDRALAGRLLRSAAAWRSTRWWTTLLMVAGVPSPVAKRWQLWREARTAVTPHITAPSP